MSETQSQKVEHDHQLIKYSDHGQGSYWKNGSFPDYMGPRPPRDTFIDKGHIFMFGLVISVSMGLAIYSKLTNKTVVEHPLPTSSSVNSEQPTRNLDVRVTSTYRMPSP